MRVLSHNVFWAQGVPFETDRPGEPNDLIIAALAERYAAIDPDVICLQEVQSEDAFRRWSIALRKLGSYSAGVLQRQYGTAVLWTAGRSVRDAHDVAGQVQRAWQVVEVPTGDGAAPLRICNVHLPSGRQVGRERAFELRRNELAVMLDEVAPPDIIGGDLNEQPGGPLSRFLAGKGYADAAEIPSRDGAPHAPATLGGRSDYLYIRDSARFRRIRYGTLAKDSLVTDLRGKTRLSDHVPIWVDIT